MWLSNESWNVPRAGGTYFFVMQRILSALSRHFQWQWAPPEEERDCWTALVVVHDQAHWDWLNKLKIGSLILLGCQIYGQKVGLWLTEIALARNLWSTFLTIHIYTSCDEEVSHFGFYYHLIKIPCNSNQMRETPPLQTSHHRPTNWHGNAIKGSAMPSSLYPTFIAVLFANFMIIGPWICM